MSGRPGFSATLAPLAGYVGGAALSVALHPWLSPFPAAAITAATLSVSALVLRRVSGTSALALLAVAFATLGLFVGLLRLEAIGGSRLKAMAGDRISIDAVVTERPKVRSARMDIVVSAGRVLRYGQEAEVSEDVLVSVFCRDRCGDLAGISEGQRLRLDGVIAEPKATPGADFDYALYLRRRGINATLAVNPGDVRILAEGRGGWQGLVDALRAHTRRSLDSGSGAAGALVLGMVLGDDSEVPEPVIEDFRDSGLLHLLAVSGQNVMLLAMVVMALCRLVLVPRMAAAAGAAVVVLIYVPLTGAGPSIVRAGIVGILGLTAMVIARPGDRYHFLALAAAIILTVNPYSIADPGFQLSFAAVLAIFLMVPALTAQLAFLPAYIAEAAAIAAAAGLATAPITLYHFEQVSLVTLPANVAAAPVAGLVMFLGTLAIIAGALLPPLAWAFSLAAAACTGYLIVVADLFASLPGAVYAGRAPGLVEIFLFYGMLVVMVRFMNRSEAGPGRRWRLVVMMLALLVLPAGLGSDCSGSSGGTSGDSIAPPAPTFSISVLDVGQGDAILLKDPAGASVLIDGGPGEAVVGLLAQNNVSRLDAVILTHPHADHVAGLNTVLKEYEVGAVYDAAPPSTSSIYGDFLKLVEKKQIPYHVLRKGQTLAFGGLTLKAYNPTDQMNADDMNANSIVLVATYDWLDILLPGDAEGAVLTRLALPPVEIYKVAHHGSRDDSLKELLAIIQPDVAVISSGAGNSYGHPTPGTLAELKGAGVQVYRTDEHGTVRLTPAAGGIEVETAR